MRTAIWSDPGMWCTVWEHLFVCSECSYRSLHRGVPYGCLRTHAIGISRMSPVTQTYRHIRDKMANVAVSLAIISDSLATLLVVIHKYEFRDLYQLFVQSKTVSRDQQKISRSGSECILAFRFWRIPVGVNFLRKGRLAPPMNVESDIVREKMHGKQIGTRLGTWPPAYYDVTGISRRDMQTNAPSVSTLYLLSS